ncbi:hypothetical protein ASC97_04115 [Rhizobium sp. Root1203]|uniref:hypothetical protein n=1 Tax=Rhizobium sp. Root1203 TaxID=1736427 RepID=UPI00070DA446|nr:hypothetical protein [Rhizobium sp. Root1203]KQV27572.1 hypothetical protein ASC97_04115 [Rhizobium sp. Root1203]
MTKNPIPCTVIDDSFSRSGCKIVLTEIAGELPSGIAKGGTPVVRTFDKSAIAVVDKDFDCVIAPVDLAAVDHFARRIIDGDPRARTESGGIMLLASAFIALLLVGSEERPNPTSTEAV